MADLGHKPQLHSGARCKLYVTDSAGNEHLIAVATDVSVSIRQSVRDTYVLGELNAMSLDPVGYDVDCSIGRVIPVNKAASLDQTEGRPTAPTAQAQSGSPIQASPYASEMGLEDLLQNLLPANNAAGMANAISIRINDKVTGKDIAVVKEARFSGRSLSNGMDIAYERLNFVGIYDNPNSDNNADTMGYLPIK